MASPKHNHQHRAGARNKQQPRAATKQRPLLLRRVMLHSCLCFLLGLFTGLAPSDWIDAASRAAASANAAATGHVFRALHAINHHHQQQQALPAPPQQPQLLVVVTTTALSERERRSAGLTRTAHALRLVSAPVVWLVVEAAREAAPTARLLRGTGVVYRHLTYDNNLSSEAGGGNDNRRGSRSRDDDEERNVALGHIEQHRLRGIVLFAGLADVYDLRVLQHLRHVRTLGAWPVATVWEKRVAVEGPVSSSSSSLVVTGWFSADGDATRMSPRPPLADVDAHGFAFSSDLLWDPARWDRFPTSEPDQSQDSIKFVQRLVVEEYNKSTRAILPHNSSQILVWRVDATLL